MLINLPLDVKALYNNILDTAVIPQSWKTATLLPIPKPMKDRNSIEGYRHISLIPFPSKILEKIVAKRLLWFAETRKLISPNQVAFKANRGCVDAHLHID